MTKIKFCGLTCAADIEAANQICPEYIGFVFAQQSRRHITPDNAAELKRQLKPEIMAVGVFVDQNPEMIISLIKRGIIDVIQLHGRESEEYIQYLQKTTGRPIIKAFLVKSSDDIRKAENCHAEHVLLDAGTGTGKTFNWDLLRDIRRRYFLAGGLRPDTAATAVQKYRPYAVDVSTGIETDGHKDHEKMAAFAAAVREVNNR